MENILLNNVNNEIVMGLNKATREDNNWLELSCFILNMIDQEDGTLAYATWEDYKSAECFENETILYCRNEDECWDSLSKITAQGLRALERNIKNVHYCENNNTLVFVLKDNSKFVALRM